MASFLYRERVENTNGVFIINSIPQCPRGLIKPMSIGPFGILSMIHTPIYPDLKREKSINVASFLYRGRVGYTNGVFTIDSIPHCTSGLETSKETNIKKCGFVSI